MNTKNYFSGEHLASHFAAIKPQLPGADIGWLEVLREDSMKRFLEIGIPGPRVEEWKYTNLGLLKNKSFNVSENQIDIDAALIDTLTIPDLTGSKVVFIDGYLSIKYTNIDKNEGIILSSLNDFVKNNPDRSKALFNNQQSVGGLSNLNLALMTGGYVLLIDENIKLAEPIQIIHFATQAENANALRTQNFIEIKQGGSAQIIENFVSLNQNFKWRQNNTHITVAKNASLEIYQFQNESAEMLHMAETYIDVEDEADFKHFSLNIGGMLSRTELKPTLIGKHANIELRGAFLGRDGASHDVFTHMKHMVPEGTSNQVYRGVLDKGGKSAFQGRVYVAKDAQLTNAEQSNKNLILDRSAEANSKPELLIYADDVKCAHGATVGELDQGALFYLKSRGLDHKAAKALLVEAFVSEVFDDIKIEPVRQKYLTLARDWLEHGE